MGNIGLVSFSGQKWSELKSFLASLSTSTVAWFINLQKKEQFSSNTDLMLFQLTNKEA